MPPMSAASMLTAASRILCEPFHSWSQDCVGILNHLVFWSEQYRRTGRMSIVFLFDENPDVASAGSGGTAVGGARSVPITPLARTQSERRRRFALATGFRLLRLF